MSALAEALVAAQASGDTAYVRFAAKVTVTASGCWLWTAYVDRDGYGQMRGRDRLVRAHRYSYEHHIGPVPEGSELHHTCETRRCVNPWHLEAVTRLAHARLGARALQTHCKRGHPLTPDNLLANRPWRSCKTCHRERMAVVRAEARAWEQRTLAAELEAGHIGGAP